MILQGHHFRILGESNKTWDLSVGVIVGGSGAESESLERNWLRRWFHGWVPLLSGVSTARINDRHDQARRQ